MNARDDAERSGPPLAGPDASALGGADAEQLSRFAGELFAAVPKEDLAASPPADRRAAAAALLAQAGQRMPGVAKLRAINPSTEEHGWASPHSALLIVNDDMPFLVDSIMAELAGREIGVHLLAHPVVKVRRDASGRMLGVGADAGDQATPESMMYVEIDRQPHEALEALDRRIEAVLADVRAAVGDWRAMRAAIAQAGADLQWGVARLGEQELAEARAFLEWLAGNHFTFLGYRRYRYAEMGATYELLPGSGLGVLRNPAIMVYDSVGPGGALPPEVRQFVAGGQALMITKADRVATVHRRAAMDCISVKIYAPDGRVEGEHRFVGLFTSSAYNLSPSAIPLLRRKIAGVIARARLDAESHDGKALLNVLETYPRDELFQASEEELHHTALDIVQLQERWRVALYVRPDRLGRFVSCLIYAPRERYDSKLRGRFAAILEAAFAGKVSDYATWIGDQSVLARVLFTVRLGGPVPAYDARAIGAALAEAARSWGDRLREALVRIHDEQRGLELARRYEAAFSTAYQEDKDAAAAVADVGRIERVLADQALEITPYRRAGQPAHGLSLKLFHPDAPIPLSDILPLLESLGLRVITEVPYALHPRAGEQPRLVYMHDLTLETVDGAAVDIERIRMIFRTALKRVWSGLMESDGFNRLVLAAQLGWREVTLLRAYCKYLRQAGIPFSQDYMERALNDNPAIARLLVARFGARFDPDRQQGAAERVAEIDRQLEAALDLVASLDQDRILRRFRNALSSTLRTNFFQTGADGWPKHWMSFKLDSRHIDDLPLPRPMVEVWVYGPRSEAIHLRGGKVARGGIRWSDRREDFRTEILGLMKAQMVKNAVIVPVGSKGGFVVKRPPAPTGNAQADREALQAEVIECYKTLMRGLLDITDNLADGAVVPPPRVVRLDGDDPYLVVAADKGTATFSDIANGVARDYGFWLDDAFASGGSAGYDHKKMAITARGAWECVKRHFRELNLDTQASDFTAVGIGDMSGDVFGNGMLRSPHIRLLAAFDHRHIFIDPDPDPARSLAERQRLFALPRSSWADYQKSLISEGGGVFERGLKSLPLGPRARALLELPDGALTPIDVMRAILKARADLLFFGGIGTYVKAAGESHADAGDRANDALRIDGGEIRARVIGEGANLGITQRGRVEAAAAGIKLNTDALDNSAGVDCSDHEVNIKIALGAAVRAGELDAASRDAFLASMTEDVAMLVLRDNYQQSQAISVAEAQAPANIGLHARFMRNLELAGKLDRAVEFLPGRDSLVQRQAAGRGLTRPELCVLLAYAKIALNEELLASDLPDDPLLEPELVRYFPAALGERHGAALARHRLKREIVAMQVVNSMINRVGPAFVDDLHERSGARGPDIARAYALARDVFALRPLWAEIEALDQRLLARAQTEMLIATQRLLEQATLWFLRQLPPGFDARQAAQRFAAKMGALAASLPAILPPADRAAIESRAQALAALNAPAGLAARVAALEPLAAAGDLTVLSERHAVPVERAAEAYFALGARLDIAALRQAAQRLPRETQWQTQAANALGEELGGLHASLAGAVLAAGGLEPWIQPRAGAIDRLARLTADLKSSAPDLAMLSVAARDLRALIG